jgi:catechol 2,3-dioxygenase-like lactoylglutathione lyase family enzyme
VAELAVAGLDLGDPRAVLLAAMRSPSTSIGYSQFLSNVSAHQVKTVELASTPGGTSSGMLANGTSFTVVIPPGTQARAAVPGFPGTNAGGFTGATRPLGARPWPYQPAGRLKEADMSSTEARSDHASGDAAAGAVGFHLEVQIIPVSDVDRSKQFYQRLGWRLDGDAAPLEGLRIVQFTPPGSAASVTFGQGVTAAAPGSAEAGLIVSDIQAAHDDLAGRGVEVSEIWHGPPFPAEARQPGPDPEHTSYGSFCSFTDPDGNLWLVQEVTTRLPGRVEGAGAAFASAADLAGALRRAEAAHAEHEKRAGRPHLFHRPGHDEDWSAWYAAYLAAEQAGTDLPA